MSRAYAKGDGSSSDIDSTDSDTNASGVQAGPMQSIEQLIGLDIVWEITAPDGGSTGRGTPPAAAGSQPWF